MPLTNILGDRLPTYTFRNRLINGDMRIDQRNAGAQQIIATTAAYCVDRWIVSPTGNSVAGQQIYNSATAPNPFSYVITGNTGVSQVLFLQRLEANNNYDLQGQTVTFSVKLSSTILTSVNWNAYYTNSTLDNWTSTVPVANSINFANGTFTINTTPTTYSATFVANNGVVNGMAIGISTGAFTSGNLIITDAQLEVSSVPTSMERRPLPVEMSLCWRYYNYVINAATTSAYAGFLRATSDSARFCVIPLPVQMRGVPAVGASFYNEANTTVGVASLQLAQKGLISVYMTTTNSAAVIDFYNITASAEL